MKNIIRSRSVCFLALSIVAVVCPVSPARAGLTVDLHVYHDSYGHYFFPFLSTNTTPPDFPTGNYEIDTWQIPTNGARLFYHATANSFDYVPGGGGNYYNNFASLMYAITNQPWSILVTNAVSTNHYTFGVTVSGATSNTLGAPVMITYPANNQIYVEFSPQFTWTGPANWEGTLSVEDDWIDSMGSYNFVDYASLSPEITTWTPSVNLPTGTNSFSVYYNSNLTANVVAATPTNASGQAISGWISTAQVETSQSIQFTVGAMPTSGTTGHTNVVYYSFEDDDLFSQDFSGHGNGITGYSWFSVPPSITGDAVSGSYAVQYSGSGWQNVPTNLVDVLASSFSVSLWLKTSDTPGDDSDSANFGAGIFAANADQVIPMAQTGSKLAFLTGGGVPDTLHSSTSINDGSYVHVVVTRNQATGEKKIYVNGTLDASDYGATGILSTSSDPNLYLGMNADLYAGFNGVVDEVQLYSGVLSTNEVMQLYNNPGTTIPDATASNPNGVAAHYDFDEGTVLAPDVSGNGNDIVHAGNFDGNDPVIDPDAIAGAGSVSFDGGGYLTAPGGLLPTLARSFSISVWVKTTQNYVSDPFFFDASGIVSADIPGGYNDLIPIGMDEYGEVVFNTGNTNQGYDDEMYSYATVNDGAWHHIVVTRDQTTGDKSIYIDGVLDAGSPESGTTNLLNDPVLLTIGALADASNSDPASPDYTGDNGYEGLLDDVQVYPRALSADEVNYLYNNPGSVVSNSAALAAVSVDLNLDIYREKSPTSGEYFFVWPSFNSITPEGTGTTTNRLESPTGAFLAQADQGGGMISSFVLNSFDDVMNAFTNGPWKLYINWGMPNQQVFYFTNLVNNLNTDLLASVSIFVPTNGAMNVPTNTPFQWSGPSNYPSLFVNALLLPTYASEGSAILPGTATNWPSPPALTVGTNQFYVNYDSNDFPNITFSVPTDTSMNQVSNWVTHVNLHTQAGSQFVVVGGGALPVQLLNPQVSGGGSFQFSFQTQTGFSHTIEMRTNLVSGTWTPLTNFSGDGTVRQFSFPATNPPIEFFRVKTQ